MSSGSDSLLMWIVFFIIVFILIRDFNCWYIKTTEISKGIKETNRLLEKLLAEMAKQRTANANSPQSSTASRPAKASLLQTVKSCKKCGRNMLENETVCSNCGHQNT